MPADRLDEIRATVLDQMERSDRNVRLAVYGAAALELVLFAVAIVMVDWSARLERLAFVFSVLTYTIVALGLAALGAHVTRTAGRIVIALDTSDVS
jgi:hypothetical protein